ncbi:N-acetylmuramoyl-L-alanine amidase [Paenibacillus sp. BSR1-1]|uniref:N-acetylmuramoyl-L-alanine amidase n=1 Tax=Paenibacillus sp. BSR1-1 TaxID=3020845 RepID=UPI0025B200C0|nr:N-acetylmuramoyl-L-alanine amidase [Paenibacillus sp. BSR1-1]MDN3019011.1 N-acetylmuramoyl-L-alanine amidase [Paenibacillus sp. BSR1-1]
MTIHETDNTSRGANAEAHARLQVRGNSRTASWHLQVDDQEIIQSIPFDEVAWAAGDGSNGPGNRTSIHIEMCVNADGDYEKTISNTVEVVQYVMSKFNIPIDRVVPHKHWTGKNCPRNLLPNWDSFIKRCQQKTNGWVKQGNQCFYYKGGRKTTGWMKVANQIYYFDANGVMKTGWVEVDNKWYYFDEKGPMKTRWVQVKGKWYYLGANGVMQTGWVKVANKYYYLDSSGAMQTSWIKVNGKTYYFNAKGEMVTGEQTIDGKTYNFGDNGLLIKTPSAEENNNNPSSEPTP